MPSLPINPKDQPQSFTTFIAIWFAKSSFSINFFWGLYEKERIFSVLIIAEVIDSFFDKPFCMDLQNFLEKLFDILVCRRLTEGSDVCDAKVGKGCKKKTVEITKIKMYLNNNLRNINYLHYK